MRKNKNNKVFGIVGLGRFGTALAETLAQAGYDIIVMDRDERRVKEVRHLTEYAYVIETIDKETLDEVGMRNCDVAIVCIGSAMDVNILTTLHLVNLGIPKVYAKAVSKDQGLILEKLGAYVVYPEHDMAVRLAKKLVATQLVDYFSLNDEIDIFELNLPNRFVGQTVAQANLRQDYGFNIIAIEHQSETLLEISPDYVFQKGDCIVVLGNRLSIHNFE